MFVRSNDPFDNSMPDNIVFRLDCDILLFLHEIVRTVLGIVILELEVIFVLSIFTVLRRLLADILRRFNIESPEQSIDDNEFP